ncbi:MAG TPA: EscU/YscU/HrcU family type III secretion system export apparatus switch protein [Syntrophomonadaceae bacterium]|nr:EscU/YscU/HrcU family type III secretion system export apparatus switch protein [Syntrophomonadaceae bacterium]
MEKEEKRKAVALRYDMERDAVPTVVAKGSGFIAQKIEMLARENGIPVKEDSQLAAYLMALDLYEEIPPELYGVVAEILAFIFNMDQRYQKVMD